MNDPQPQNLTGAPHHPEPERPVIEIVHTNDDGTLVYGTERDDGSRDALRSARCRWSRSLKAWFMPHSRGQAPARERIERLARSLRNTGFEVEVEIEEYDPAAAFAARQAASQTRSDRLADHDVQRSAAARRQAKRRENPVVMGRKVQRLEAQAGALERILATATGEYADGTRLRLAEVQAEIAFFRKAREDTGARQYTKQDFKKGDLALIRGQWRVVRKANAKSVAVETGYSWTDNYPYHEVTGQRPQHSTAGTD